jgi:hypothetical protein
LTSDRGCKDQKQAVSVQHAADTLKQLKASDVPDAVILGNGKSFVDEKSAKRMRSPLALCESRLARANSRQLDGAPLFHLRMDMRTGSVDRKLTGAVTSRTISGAVAQETPTKLAAILGKNNARFVLGFSWSHLAVGSLCQNREYSGIALF